LSLSFRALKLVAGLLITAVHTPGSVEYVRSLTRIRPSSSFLSWCFVWPSPPKFVWPSPPRFVWPSPPRGAEAAASCTDGADFGAELDAEALCTKVAARAVIPTDAAIATTARLRAPYLLLSDIPFLHLSGMPTERPTRNEHTHALFMTPLQK
jgi:hypothetical protein